MAGSNDFTVLPGPATPLAIAAGARSTSPSRLSRPPLAGVEVATIQITSNDPVTPLLDLLTEGRGGAGALETVIADDGEIGERCALAHRDEPLTPLTLHKSRRNLACTRAMRAGRVAGNGKA